MSMKIKDLVDQENDFTVRHLERGLCECSFKLPHVESFICGSTGLVKGFVILK